MKLTSFIRINLAMLFKAADFNLDFIKMQNKKFFNNHDKISGWFKGYPSMSFYTPPIFSRPSVNSLITKLMSLYQWRKLPEIMSIAINDECNCSCKYCSFTSMKKDDPPLTTDMIIDTIKKGQRLGVSTISIVGGEPLMHEDLIKIIKSIDKDLSQVILFTNGYFLKEKAKELKKAGVTAVITSIDSHDPEIHDKLKNKAGLFKRAVEGIKEAGRQGLLTGISSVIHKEDINNENLDKLIELGKNLKINEHILFDAIPTGNYIGRSDLIFNENEIEKLIAISEKYNEKKNYPHVFPYAYLKSSRSIGCTGGVSYFYISPYGNVCPCDFNTTAVGNVKNENLFDIWDKFNEKNGFNKTCLCGCRTQLKYKS